MLEAALELHGQGFHIFPLGAYQERPPQYYIDKKGGDINVAMEKWPKEPRISTWKEYQNVQPTVEQIEKWWSEWPDANIAVITGIQVNVVDADSKEAIEWCDNYLPLTPYRVNTSQGKHYYYDVDPDVDVSNSVGVHAKIDIRGVGGYVVAAGSRHASGMHYGVERLPGMCADSHVDFPRLAEVDVQRIKQRNREMKPTAIAPVTDGSSMMDLRQYGKDPIGEPTNEGSRNNELARFAGLCYQQGYSLEETLDRAMQWNQHNKPPLPDQEILRTVESVSNTHFQNTGKIVPAVAPVSRNVPSMIFKYGDLLDDPPEEPEMFWGERCLFRGSRALLAGEPKIGKSRVALSMGATAAIGGEFLGQRFSKPLRFMWMQAEIHRSWLPERVQAVTRYMNKLDIEKLRENLLISGRLSLDLMHSERDRDNVRKALDVHRPDIWAVDPIIEFSSVEENSNQEVSALLGHVNSISEEFDCACLMVHHIGKPKAGQSLDFNSIRGAGAFRGWYDTGLMISGDEKKPVFAWEVRNGKSPPAHLAAFNEADGRYTCEMIQSEEKKQDDYDVGQDYKDRVHHLISQQRNKEIGRDELRQLISDTYGIESLDALKAIAAFSEGYQCHMRKRDDGTFYFKLEAKL